MTISNFTDADLQLRATKAADVAGRSFTLAKVIGYFHVFMFCFVVFVTIRWTQHLRRKRRLSNLIITRGERLVVLLHVLTCIFEFGHFSFIGAGFERSGAVVGDAARRHPAHAAV